MIHATGRGPGRPGLCLEAHPAASPASSLPVSCLCPHIRVPARLLFQVSLVSLCLFSFPDQPSLGRPSWGSVPAGAEGALGLQALPECLQGVACWGSALSRRQRPQPWLTRASGSENRSALLPARCSQLSNGHNPRAAASKPRDARTCRAVALVVGQFMGWRFSRPAFLPGPHGGSLLRVNVGELPQG